MPRKQETLKPLRFSTSQAYFLLILRLWSTMPLTRTPDSQNSYNLEHCQPLWLREEENHMLALKASTQERHSSFVFTFIGQSAKTSHTAVSNFKGGREQEMVLPCALGEDQKYMQGSPDDHCRGDLGQTPTFWPS